MSYGVEQLGIYIIKLASIMILGKTWTNGRLDASFFGEVDGTVDG